MARDAVRHKATLALWREKNRGRVRKYSRDWRAANLDKARQSARDNKRRQRAQIRTDCIIAYGGRCVCCEEDEPKFLTIDHIDGKGARHRHRLKLPVASSGYAFYEWLRKQRYPKDNYRLLCFNCNCGRHYNGGICPHEKNR